jgi:hypothetical protein
MFVIERVIGLRFPKNGMHIVYKIEKTQPAAASQAIGEDPILMMIFSSPPALGLARATR